ncbi:RNA polymerase sigma factor (sigma-70 family) [Cerasibacillus quisquiliarum]|uniref:RNA polymerase sigma-70 region 4 domain-containing protein n=1 Tax=Cerasibacillus quisquiliarum TaxID=227865 RepID=A0A511V0B9_9BACI|nr:sigma-70 family RNA polymerase sigma factor [Cerasibacillus quisquiliarum]MBB5147507.1 RNA polymerase sigma factor (sigma-70 family) [Cerasibacillus quisquiliarum]GEN32357.1 hypothetical protein CQU01_25950 [Cerasibacillus quisquiliarum]
MEKLTTTLLMNGKQKIINNFFSNKKKALKNPLIYHFLKINENYKLVERAILYPTEHNKSVVENAFKKHYENIVKIKYVKNLIHFYSIDYDKKIRKLKSRFILTLDQEISDEQGITQKELISVQDHAFDNIFNTSLFTFTDNETLITGLKSLTKKQLIILNLIYIKELKLIEIANLLGTTPQNISNQHRKSLNKLYNYLKSGDYHEK